MTRVPASGGGSGGVLVAGPNLGIDRTLWIDEIRPGEVLRFRRVEVTAGGKGVNVCRAARALGFGAILVSLLPGHTGAAVGKLIADEGLDLVGIDVPGEIRSTAITLEDSGRVTVFNEPGPELAGPGWTRYEWAVSERLEACSWLVCTGSVPPGAPADAYARLVGAAAGHGRRTLVDAGGPLLDRALVARPDVVTPNLPEAEAVLWGPRPEHVHQADVHERARSAAAGLSARGPRLTVVTAGSLGAAVGIGGSSWWVDAIETEARNPIGAGDAFAAGLVCELARGTEVGTAVARAMGAAASSVEVTRAGAVQPARVPALTPSPPPEVEGQLEV